MAANSNSNKANYLFHTSESFPGECEVEKKQNKQTNQVIKSKRSNRQSNRDGSKIHELHIINKHSKFYICLRPSRVSERCIRLAYFFHLFPQCAGEIAGRRFG